MVNAVFEVEPSGDEDDFVAPICPPCKEQDEKEDGESCPADDAKNDDDKEGEMNADQAKQRVKDIADAVKAHEKAAKAAQKANNADEARKEADDADKLLQKAELIAEQFPKLAPKLDKIKGHAQGAKDKADEV
jgi:hypothetical protein